MTSPDGVEAAFEWAEKTRGRYLQSGLYDHFHTLASYAARLEQAIIRERPCFLKAGEEHLWDRDMAVRAQLRREIIADVLSPKEPA